MNDQPDCTCGHTALAHDYRYGTCYETGEGNCDCLQYSEAWEEMSGE